MKIGFFDSGVGGMTILQAVRQYLPEYDHVFFGDTEHLPYGDKTESEIYELTKAGITKLFEKGVLLAVVACNTASAEALRKLQDTFLKEAFPDRKVLGVIIPTVETIDELGFKKPLLIGTIRTIASGKYDTELKKINPDIKLISLATPKLTPLIESGNIQDACTSAVDSIDQRVGEADSIILGCTHYVLLKDTLRARYTIPVISQDEIIPKKLEQYLQKHTEIETQLTHKGTVELFVSKESAFFNQLKKERS